MKKEDEGRDERKKGQQEVQTLTNSYLMVDYNKSNGVIPRLYNYTDYNAFSKPTEDIDISTGSITQSGSAIPSPIVGKYIHLPDGSVTLPALAWASETSSGRYKIGSNNFGESVAGTLVFDWNGSQMEYATGYKVRIGTSTSIYGSGTETISILETQNSNSGMVVKNASTGTLGIASVAVVNSLDNDVTLGMSSTGLTGQLGGVMTIGAGDGFCGVGRYTMSGTGGDFWLYNLFSTKSIIFATNATRRGSWVSGGALIVGTATSALASELLRVQGGIVSSALTQSGVVYAGANGLLSTDHTHFSYDATNFRVGINNTAPNRPLDVVSASSTTACARFGRNTSNNGMYLTSFADSQLCVSGGAEFVTSNWIARASQATIVLSCGDGVTGGDLWVLNGTSLSAGSSFTPTTRMYMTNTGLFGVGTGATAARRIESLDATNPQLRLSHTASTVITDFQTNSSGNLTISPTNDIVIIDDALRVGTVTTAADAGDFETGLTGAARMFYDQSVPTLALYNSSGTVVNLLSAVASTATVWNEQGADIDFRIEGDTLASLIHVDASADKVGFNTSSPDRLVDIELGDGNPQMRLTYTSASLYCDFRVSSEGDLVISPSGNDLFVTGTAVDDYVGYYVENLASSGDSHAYIQCNVDSASTGDPALYFRVVGALFWTLGIDNDDSDKFKICGSDTIGTNDFLVIETTGSAAVGKPSLATNATDGFLYVPACAGTPTGVPTGVTGMAPIVVNSTNNKLYFYSGGAWRDAGP